MEVVDRVTDSVGTVVEQAAGILEPEVVVGIWESEVAVDRWVLVEAVGR